MFVETPALPIRRPRWIYMVNALAYMVALVLPIYIAWATVSYVTDTGARIAMWSLFTGVLIGGVLVARSFVVYGLILPTYDQRQRSSAE